MREAFFCYAPEDSARVHEVGSYLALNTSFEIAYEEGCIRPGFDLISAVEQGLSSQAILVFLSAHSVPARWISEQWEAVLIKAPPAEGVSIGYVLLGACNFPQRLRRQKMFDLTANAAEGLQALRRWLLGEASFPEPVLSIPALPSGPLPIPDEMRRFYCRLAEVPGIADDVDADIALCFAHAYEEDFETVLWIDCRGLTLAGIAGQVGYALGYPASGTLEENLARMRMVCSVRRCLLVFDGLDVRHAELRISGKASVVFTAPHPHNTSKLPSRGELFALFAGKGSDVHSAVALLGHAQELLRELSADDSGDWEPAKRLGRGLYHLLRRHGRLAECAELLDALINRAGARRDAISRGDWIGKRREVADILGETYSIGRAGPRQPMPEQLCLNF